MMNAVQRITVDHLPEDKALKNHPVNDFSFEPDCRDGRIKTIEALLFVDYVKVADHLPE